MGREMRLVRRLEPGDVAEREPALFEVVQLTLEDLADLPMRDVEGLEEAHLDALALPTLADDLLLRLVNSDLQLADVLPSSGELFRRGLQSRDLGTSLLECGTLVHQLLVELGQVASVLCVRSALFVQLCPEARHSTAEFGWPARERVFELLDPGRQLVSTRLSCRQIGRSHLHGDALVLVAAHQFFAEAELQRAIEIVARAFV
jgi:hypothetical protein